MPLTLVFKRSKSFVLSGGDEGTKQFLATANPASPVPVPFWVVKTPTYQYGIKDGSIINLTPPEQMPGYRPAATALDEPEELPVEDDVEQTEIPVAAFGAQPMTPVAPSPKIGGITAASKRTR